ncbi:MAG: LamG-like jellyroll fold domain-containing protein [Paludibacteraceae bacterium]
MKKFDHIFKKKRFPTVKIILLLLMLFSIGQITAVNPSVSTYWTNLSGSLNTDSQDERNAEFIVEGNTLHTVWLEYKYGTTATIWYRRSTDLGKTWENPVKIYELLEKNSPPITSGYSKILSVENSVVTITFADYEYSNNGTGKIFYTRSTDNGATFLATRELVNSGGGYNKIHESILRVNGNHVAIAYGITGGSKKGIHVLYSTDGGENFNDTIVADAALNTSLADFYYDGNQMIFLHQYLYFMYGFAKGKMYCTVSNDNGFNFATQKVSKPYLYNDSEVEKFRTLPQGLSLNYEYRPRIAKTNNTIHLVFDEYARKDGSTSEYYYTVYVRSTDNGATFADPVRFEEQGASTGVIAAKGNRVYIANYKDGRILFRSSEDGGTTFTSATDFFETGFVPHIKRSEVYDLLIDPTDETGKTVHIVGNNHLLATSADGGKTFPNVMTYTDCFNNIKMTSNVAIDNNGVKHWLIRHIPKNGSDYDVYYHTTGSEPQDGSTNKYFSCEVPQANRSTIGLAVPSSPSLRFDSLLTVEMWVKFDPANTYKSPLLTRMKSGTYYDDTPYGYQIGYRSSGGKVALNAGIQTDNGRFVNWCPSEIADTLWHHVAFTYNANGGLDNFMTYVDGIVKAKQTVIGAIDAGDGMTTVGMLLDGNIYYDINFQIDEVRLWKKSLTKEELQANMTRTDFSDENDLKLYLGFDDTFKDLSGNGNDAVPMLNADLIASNFNPPVAGFETYKALQEVSFTNHTQNGKNYNWSFGNTATSTLENPKHRYRAAGEYDIDLLASNENAVTSATRHVSIEGIDRVYPTGSGNTGYVTLDVYGGALTAADKQVILRREGNADITAQEVSLVSAGNLRAKFLFNGATVGKWDVVIKQNGAESVLPNVFTLESAEPLDNWVRVSGRGATLLNRWQSYRISYGNNSNIDCYAVPLWVAVTESPDLEIEFFDFVMDVPEYYKNHPEINDFKALGEYFVTDSIEGKPMRMRVIPIMLPEIRANSASELTLRLKTNQDIEIRAFLDRPMITSQDLIEADAGGIPPARYMKQAAPFSAECVVKTLGMGVLDATTTALPAVGCIWGGIKIGYTVYSHVTSKKPSMWNTLWNIGLSTVDCGVSLAKNVAFPITFGMAVINFGNAVYDLHKCREPRAGDKKNVDAVSSFDPNEMIGPNGHGTENWIKPIADIPYTILFENKSTATAPAHDVVVTDTLDLNSFDVEKFSFEKYGWGDSIFSQVQSGSKEFSRDIDLRPAKELIVRVSGKLDKISGVVRFEFKSLNPVTLSEEDPFLGFLPPNDANRAGEGFVSYSVGLKSDLGTGAKLRNKASIVFDANAPILTNEFVNTIDRHIPYSAINAVEKVGTDSLRIHWTSSDEGSGVRDYRIYAQKDDDEVLAVLTDAVDNSGVVKAEPDATYKFFSEATDNAGWQENKNGQFDIVFVNTRLKNVDAENNRLNIYPNPAKDIIYIQLKDAASNDCSVEMIDTDGKIYNLGKYSGMRLNTGIKIRINEHVKGLYLIRLTADNASYTRKIAIE